MIPAIEAGLDSTYVYGYEYADATGAPLSIAYPAGGGLVDEKITTDYDATTGTPTSINTSLTGSVGTMATATYTTYGERDGSVYKTPNGVYTQDTIYRDEATRRIKRTTIERENIAGTVSDRNYDHDDAGNITSIADTPQVGVTDIQCFRQDELGRLETAWTPKVGVSCKTDPSVANLAGPAPYWQDWTFTNTGSRVTETSHTTAGETTRSSATPTGGQGVVRPHAVTAMTTQVSGQSDVVNKYAYDNTGNTTCRPTGTTANDCATGTNSQTLGWNAEDKLATVNAGGKNIETNIYDANGVRLIRRDTTNGTTSTTLYLPGQEIRRQGTVNTGTRYYDFAGTTIASRVASSAINNLTWLYNDHQGTQQVAINASTQSVTTRRQTPYGTPRGPNPTWLNSKGFVGGQNDPTNLVNIGARQYDQTLGRFISVDPVMDVADPQQWNPYTYANNSPVTNSDPTGMLWINDGGGKYIPPSPVSPAPSPTPAPGKGGSGQGGRPASTGTPSPSPQGAPIPISCIPKELCADPLVEAAVGFVPFSDAPDCLQGDKLACGFTAVDAVPGGKIANGIGAAGSALVTARRLSKYADDFAAGRGLWSLPFRERGYALEKRILDEMELQGLPTPNNPTIDAFDFATGTATSVKTKALDEGFYNGKSLQAELRRDVRKLEKYDGKTFGDAVIKETDIKHRQLVVGIPSGTVSREQYAAMVDGYNYGLKRGVNVMYVIVK